MRNLIAAATALFTLTACSNYEVTVNDNVMYSPPPLFSDYAIKDPELKKCVKATIVEDNIRSAKQLKTLLCPSNNIAGLTGLEVFIGIENLDISNNSISTLNALRALPVLKQLNAQGNQLKNISALNGIKTLRHVNLGNNPQLECDSINNKNVLTLIHSRHCL